MFRNFLLLTTLLGFLSAAFATNGNWTMVTTDDSGKYLTASSSEAGSYPGNIFTSNDYGSTWAVSSFSYPWMGVASDSTGQKLVAVGQCYPGGSCGAPYETIDRGVNWIAPTSADHKDNYYDVSSDAAGVNVVSSAGGNVYHTGNGGSTWGRYNLDSGYCGTAVAISGDGKTVAIDYKEYITFTKDGGNSWTTAANTPTARWRRIAADYSGDVISGAYDMRYGSGGNFDSGWVLSDNGGATWTSLKMTTDGEKYYSVAASADGAYVFCGGSSGIYIYNVAKKTITKSSAGAYGYYSITASKTGQYVLASSGGLYLSTDYGATFKLVK